MDRRLQKPEVPPRGAVVGEYAVRFEGTFAVRAPRARVWSFFRDPQAFTVCIDDPHTLEVIDRERFQGTVKAGIAFIRGTFDWSATFGECSPPEHATMVVRGSGMGSEFEVLATFDLSEMDDLTTIHWIADVQVKGALANVGSRLMQATTEKKTNAFFENARKALEGP
jgi:uncharacterized protein